MITKKETIKELQLFAEAMECPPLETVNMAIEVLNQTGWIPVSKKLPEDPRPVLVTILWHEPYDNYEVSIEEYWDNGDGWGDWPGAEIIAWMPLPEPYKGEKE